MSLLENWFEIIKMTYRETKSLLNRDDTLISEEALELLNNPKTRAEFIEFTTGSINMKSSIGEKIDVVEEKLEDIEEKLKYIESKRESIKTFELKNGKKITLVTFKEI